MMDDTSTDSEETEEETDGVATTEEEGEEKWS